MLYVFHVDMGRMMSFDMTVALSSVENLKDTIERLHGIPASNIVLLVSGGEMLTKSTQVSYYSAGTDTNPIYMFLTGEIKLPPTMPQTEPDLDLREQVDRSLELPAVYETVMTRAQLAVKMYDLARDEDKLCERLVHEQHLQQQGWSAVVANMEDLTDEFRQRFKNFCVAFDRHLEKRGTYLELLRNFGDDLTKLSRIPILPALMALAEEDFHGFDEFLDTDEVFARSQQQQDSVLVGVRPSGSGADVDVAITDDGGGDCGETSDTEKSMTSTSPNKKLKMGNELIEERTTTATSQGSTASFNQRRTLTLLQWISAKENHNTLKLMSDECVQGLGTFNEDVYDKLKAEVQNIIKLADQGDVKEIKGLGERLCKLEEFKYKIKSMVQDQKELSTAFQQNQNRAINLRDASILPDLCASHQSQLLVMLQNHQKIRDHKRCIAKAKDELGINLHTRLKRIVWIENAMSEFDNRLLFYHRCLRRAERHINIIDQIHQAPCIYVAAVTEVVRRKIFSGEFRIWASKLADDFDSIHSEEIKRRQLFNASFEGHFLNILFPGMNDMPPAFANENPLIFDARLPNITRSDIDMLSSSLPDLTAHVQLPDMGPVINFFVSRSGEHQKERMEEILKEQATQALNVKLLQHQRLGELQREAIAVEGVGGSACDESETDTEEFEKVVDAEVTPVPITQSVTTSTSELDKETIARSTATERLEMQNVETLTEENNAEVERLREVLGALSKLSVDCIKLARANLETLRTDSIEYRQDLQSELQTLNDKWNLIRMHTEAKELERTEELQELRALLSERNNEVLLLQAQLSEKEVLQMHCNTFQEQMEQMQEQLKNVEQDKARAVAEIREKLIHEHKTEIESLRCRFKLMTSMERSPSEGNLEKIDKLQQQQSDMIEIACHEAICAQLRDDLYVMKEKEITAALEAERSIWQSKIFPMNSESVMANVSVLKEMLEEKERQLDMMREKDLMLTKENYQLKTRFDALTNEDGNSWLREKIEYLNKDKCRLEEELTVEKLRRVEMETSVAALRSSTYEQAVATAGTLPRSKSSGSSHKYIVLESCGKGDIVFVVWSIRHGQFMVVQDSQSLYFVHGDSLAALNLRLPATPSDAGAGGSTATDEIQPTIPMPYYAIGRVTEKEYCQARKDENRYRVTRGSKFYRIKLAPLTSKLSTRRERLESFSTSISRSISQCESHSESSSNATLRPSLSTGSASNATATAIGGSSNLKDVVDSAVGFSSVIVTTTSVATSPTIFVASSAIGSAPSLLGFKERTISITSVTEEDDEPISLLSERCRYISVSEEEEPPAAQATAMTTTTTAAAALQQQSVITEQPTASTTNLKLDLMLASADIPHVTNNNNNNTTESSIITTTISSTTSTTSPSVVVVTTATTTKSTATAIVMPTTASCYSPSIPTSVGTSEDSDEYRSLEAKDDSIF